MKNKTTKNCDKFFFCFITHKSLQYDASQVLNDAQAMDYTTFLLTKLSNCYRNNKKLQERVSVITDVVCDPVVMSIDHTVTEVEGRAKCLEGLSQLLIVQVLTTLF